MRKIYLLSLLTLGVAFNSCSEYLDPIDTSIVTPDQVADILTSHESAMVQGIYSRAIEYDSYHDQFGIKSIGLYADMMSQDIVMPVSHFFVYDYNFDYNAANYRRTSYIWEHCYSQIRDCNNITAAFGDPESLTDDQKVLLGEALALRAYYYFILVNYYQFGGDWDTIKDKAAVPIYTTASLDSAPRSTVSEVYELMLADCADAVEYLANASFSNTRLGLNGAKLLYARIALYKGDYALAESMASEVVAATSLMSTTEYQGGFDDISNVEWLWGADITTLTSTLYASFFSHMDAVNLAGYAGIGVLKVVDASLYDSMADNDVRKACVDGFGDDDCTYYPGLQLKFRDDTKKFEGDYVFLRSAEAYYIKAEAEAAQDKISDAQATLDIISDARATDGVSTYVWSSDKTELIDQIFLHKRIEMWGEGFGLFEFNRLMKTIDRTYDGTNHPAGNVIGGDRAIPWGDTARYMQIPNSELEGNEYISSEDQNPL